MEARRSDATPLGNGTPLANGTPRPSFGMSAGSGFEVGAWVWSPCVRSGFRRSTIVSLDAESDCILVDRDRDESDPGGQTRLRMSDVRPFFEIQPENTREDNTELVHLDDANILDNIRVRYYQDKIYTYTANVLLAVNPYKQLRNLYTDDVMAEYRNIKNIGTKQPHPFAIADMAYRQLLREWRDQALIISGESGAGKTETAKITMRYLADVSRTDAARGGQIQDKIINANPILESFGNAQTTRNRNSSRFGKYNEMYFNRVGSLVGAGIKTFLLESSRVVHQQEKEQNYHVFYQMISGLSADDLEDMYLETTTKYKLLYPENSRLPSESESARRREDFASLQQALDVVGFVPDFQKEVFEVVAALVHFGEIEFKSTASGEDEASLASALNSSMTDFQGQSTQPALVELVAHDSLAWAAELLGFSETKLLHVLKWKEMHVPNRRSHIRCPRTLSQAQQTAQSIVKILYKRLFEQIVQRINASSAGSSGGTNASRRSDAAYQPDHVNIGTLDIYGFERLGVNSFEQLCINLANERLQQFFVEEVLEAEQKMYHKESINLHDFDLPDSKPVVVAVHSVMAILDDHSKRFIKNLVQQGGDIDQKFCENVHRDHIPSSQDRRASSGCPLFPLRLKASRSEKTLGQYDGFVIKHYAGEVSYTTSGWIEKNNDALLPEVESLLLKSKKALVCSLGGEVENETGERFSSVSRSYLANLNDLLSTLKESQLHYIRCFNPNEKKASGMFDKKYVLDQVIQCGTVELVKIMHDGFPHRCKLEAIRNRFANLLPEDFRRYKDRDFVEAIMIAFELPSAQWTIGTTRLFLKAGQLRVLEDLLDSGSTASQDMIQKIRRQFARKKLRAVRTAIRFAIWLPKHAKKLRRETVLIGLRKTCFNYVRIMRWLHRARRILYGEAPPRDVNIMEWKMQLEGVIPPLFQKGKLQCPPPRRPQLFVALNLEELPDFRAVSKNPSAWQRGASESILFHNQGVLMSVHLDAKQFVDAPSHRMDASASRLTDVRYVDLFGSCLAFRRHAELGAESREIDFVCQHSKDMNVFAACCGDKLLAFTWRGIAHLDTSRPPIEILSAVTLDKDEILYGMCFLSDVPEGLQYDNVLMLLTGLPSQHFLSIKVVGLIGCQSFTLDTLNIGDFGQYESLLEAARSGQLVFKISHSDRILVVAGKGIMLFYEVKMSPELSVEFLYDVVKSENLEHEAVCITSCLCLRPINRHHLDWIVLGDAEGSLFGLSWIWDESKQAVQPQSVGRLRQKKGEHNRHDVGVPIGLLIGTYGSAPDTHHPKVQEMGCYGWLLTTMQCEKDRFFSIGENGKFLRWVMQPRIGWTSDDERRITDILSQRQHEATKIDSIIAGQCSKLVPHVLLLVDQHRGIHCFDTRSMSPMRGCTFGGA